MAGVSLTEVIARFEGEHRFLSNFWVHEDGLSVEHFFQAGKAKTREDWDYVMASETPGRAKRRGREIALREDWDDIRIETMMYLVFMKFKNPGLREKLLATGDAILIEGNHWGDTFWGVDIETGEGENHLGVILMDVRTLIRALLAAENSESEDAALHEAVVSRVFE
jgi:ribA/ribD-fused uncharacterized protein